MPDHSLRPHCITHEDIWPHVVLRLFSELCIWINILFNKIAHGQDIAFAMPLNIAIAGGTSQALGVHVSRGIVSRPHDFNANFLVRQSTLVRAVFGLHQLDPRQVSHW